MLPLSDGVPARRFPIVKVLLIVANFAVFIFCELPHLNTVVWRGSLPTRGKSHPEIDCAPPRNPAGSFPDATAEDA